jgi:hypothetical protein
MVALMLFAIESHSSSQRAWPNQALERTAARRMFRFQMTKTVSVEAARDLGGGRSACSR